MSKALGLVLVRFVDTLGDDPARVNKTMADENLLYPNPGSDIPAAGARAKTGGFRLAGPFSRRIRWKA